jgi:hypothetical protein
LLTEKDPIRKIPYTDLSTAGAESDKEGPQGERPIQGTALVWAEKQLTLLTDVPETKHHQFFHVLIDLLDQLKTRKLISDSSYDAALQVLLNNFSWYATQKMLIKR